MAKIFKELLSVDARAIMNVTEFAEFLQVNGVLLACQFIASTGKISSAEKFTTKVTPICGNQFFKVCLSTKFAV